MSNWWDGKFPQEPVEEMEFAQTVMSIAELYEESPYGSIYIYKHKGVITYYFIEKIAGRYVWVGDFGPIKEGENIVEEIKKILIELDKKVN